MKSHIHFVMVSLALRQANTNVERYGLIGFYREFKNIYHDYITILCRSTI